MAGKIAKTAGFSQTLLLKCYNNTTRSVYFQYKLGTPRLPAEQNAGAGTVPGPVYGELAALCSFVTTMKSKHSLHHNLIYGT